MRLEVFRFEDVEFRSHVIARCRETAIEIFDAVMGRDYRTNEDFSVEIYAIDDDTVLSIELLGEQAIEKTAAEWMAEEPTERFL